MYTYRCTKAAAKRGWCIREERNKQPGWLLGGTAGMVQSRSRRRAGTGVKPWWPNAEHRPTVFASLKMTMSTSKPPLLPLAAARSRPASEGCRGARRRAASTSACVRPS